MFNLSIRFYLYTTFILASLFFTQQVYANSQQNFNELGSAIIDVYPPEDYKSESTNWFVQQHENGIIFLANFNGLHSFDGTKWRSYTTLVNTPIIQFVIRGNRIYIGTHTDVGYFIINAEGLSYHSLLAELTKEQRNFTQVNNVYAFEQRIYFVSPEQIMSYDPQTGFQVLLPKISFRRAWQTGTRLFFTDGDLLKYIENNEVHIVPFQENKSPSRFSFVQSITVENNKQAYLIGTYQHGVYLWHNNAFSPWIADSRPEAKYGMYNSLPIGDNIIAIATIHNGVILVNHAGETIYHLNTDNGLPVNITLNIFLDSQQGLWLAQEGQLTRVQLPFELSTFTTKQADIANIIAFTRLNNTLYLAAINGIMTIDKHGEVKNLENVIFSAKDIIQSHNKLIIAGSGGCQIYDPLTGDISILLKTTLCHDLYLSKINTDLLFITTEQGLFVSTWNSVEWQSPIQLIQENELNGDMVEDEQGQIWIASQKNQLIRTSLQKGEWQTQRIEFDSLYPKPLVLDGKLIISTKNGLFNWDNLQQSLTNKVSWFHNYFGNNAPAPTYLYRDSKQRLWLSSSQHSGYLTFNQGKPDSWHIYPVTASSMKSLNTVFVENNVTWLGFVNGVVRYQPQHFSVDKTLQSNIHARISEIYDKTENKSLGVMLLNNNKVLDIQYQHSLRVFFSLSNYLQSKNNEFRYRLNKQNWSAWSKESYVDLGHLNGGSYNISMQARDVQNNIYTAEQRSFNVIPPWYLNQWAYLLYVMAGLALLIGTAKLYAKSHTRRLLVEQQRLEQQVVERTATIQQQTDKLTQMAEAKSRFFANVSHEFRTPLTLTIGPLQTIIQQQMMSNPQGQEYLRIALENSQQMLSLVGQLLDINRLESGEMVLSVVKLSLADVIKNSIKPFQLLAQKQQIYIVKIGLEQQSIIWFDVEHLKTIMSNLLSNAIKFSPAGSKIEVGLKLDQRNQQWILWVKDQGYGIPDNERSQLFKRFYQGKNSSNSLQPGTGIGLSMIKELLELHQGSVELDNNYTNGCLFKVTLKTGSIHYQTKHFADNATHNVSVSAEDSSFVEKESAEPSNLETKDTGIVLANHDEAIQSLPTVLVVDDNEDLRLFIRATIQSNYNVITASNGQQALQQVELAQPDFIISDIMMPVMDGLEFTQHIKDNAATAHIPLLLLSAKNTKRQTVEGLQGGADDYLTKPFDSSELIARIAAHLQQKRNIARSIYKIFMDEQAAQAKYQETEPSNETHKDSFEFKFIRFIADNLTNPKLNVPLITQSLHLERRTLLRKVKAAFACTPNQYIKNQRLQRALHMLQQQCGSISEIAYAVGFQNMSYFSRSFSEYFGVAPSDYTKITNLSTSLKSK